jgi:23S rRNA (guanosine2251-2'-O)-methyltransferase
MFRKLKNQELNRLTISQYKEVKKTPLIVVLDNVRSMNNVGSVFRTSDCFRIEKIILCGITAQPPHRDIRKTAIGAEESVPWEYYESTEEAVAKLKGEGYKIISVEQAENSVTLEEFIPKENSAIVFGNEIDGVMDSIVQQSDECVEIPQFGTKHSFNIAVSAGIVLWDCFRKLN